jgi:hypothetical protein
MTTSRTALAGSEIPDAASNDLASEVWEGRVSRSTVFLTNAESRLLEVFLVRPRT